MVSWVGSEIELCRLLRIFLLTLVLFASPLISQAVCKTISAGKINILGLRYFTQLTTQFAK